MKIRYVGPDEARDLAFAGGVIVCPRMKWVDVEKEAGPAADHALIVAREVVKELDWENEAVKKAAKTRAKNRGQDAAPAVEPPEEVEEPEAAAPLANEEQE